jgi:hypothetical protein
MQDEIQIRLTFGLVIFLHLWGKIIAAKSFEEGYRICNLRTVLPIVSGGW